MKARPLKKVREANGGITYVECAPEEVELLEFYMPGPSRRLMLPVMLHGRREGTDCWTWNGSTEAPTLRPSIRTKGHDFLCHSWLNDGKVQFLTDSTHALAGQTVELLDLD